MVLVMLVCSYWTLLSFVFGFGVWLTLGRAAVAVPAEEIEFVKDGFSVPLNPDGVAAMDAARFCHRNVIHQHCLFGGTQNRSPPGGSQVDTADGVASGLRAWLSVKDDDVVRIIDCNRRQDFAIQR